jgi:hypothetical protein
MVNFEPLYFGGCILVIAGVIAGLITLWKSVQLVRKNTNDALGRGAVDAADGEGELAKAWAELIKAISGAPPWIAAIALGSFLIYLDPRSVVDEHKHGANGAVVSSNKP